MSPHEPERLHYGCEQVVSSPPESPSPANIRVEPSHPALAPSNQLASSEKQAQLIARRAQWYFRMRKLQTLDEQAASSLLMLYHVSLVKASTWLSLTQKSCDQYIQNFRTFDLLVSTQRGNEPSRLPLHLRLVLLDHCISLPSNAEFHRFAGKQSISCRKARKRCLTSVPNPWQS
jgi:hypothetical protein